MILGNPIQVTQQIANIFFDLQIHYMIGGSLASSLHGIPRATQDVDIVADIKHHHVKEFVKALNNVFYVDEDMIKKALVNRSSFNIIHLETMFKVDIFVMKEDAASKEAMSRRQSYPISEDSKQELYLTSAEDIIVQKLHWFELGDRISERQWKDVISVLQVQGKQLDYDYLQQAATRMNVYKLLEQAIKEVEEITSE